MPINPLTGNTATDLGMGGGLQQQTAAETEEEKRRRRLGMSPLAAGSQSAMALWPGLAASTGLGGGLPGVRGGRGY